MLFQFTIPSLLLALFAAPAPQGECDGCEAKLSHSVNNIPNACVTLSFHEHARWDGICGEDCEPRMPCTFDLSVRIQRHCNNTRVMYEGPDGTQTEVQGNYTAVGTNIKCGEREEHWVFVPVQGQSGAHISAPFVWMAPRCTKCE